MPRYKARAAAAAPFPNRAVARVGIAAATCLTALALATAAQAQSGASDAPGAGEAIARMIDTKGEDRGAVTLEETPRGVLLSLDLEGLPPGTRAFHIHEVGRCDTPDFESAVGHFNPDDAKHGFHAEHGAHAGDLPNLHVPENGRLRVEFLTRDVTLAEGAANGLFRGEGTSLVIHEGADDYRTDPAGDAGDRIVCGVVTR